MSGFNGQRYRAYWGRFGLTSRVTVGRGVMMNDEGVRTRLRGLTDTQDDEMMGWGVGMCSKCLNLDAPDKGMHGMRDQREGRKRGEGSYLNFFPLSNFDIINFFRIQKP